jgi:hypothetical protein
MRKLARLLICGIVATALMPTLARANSGDFSGGVAVGSSYAGTDTAPTNGLIVQGNVGIGTDAPVNALDVSGGAVIGSGYAGVDTAPTNGLLIQGNVGIANTSPNALLDIGTAATTTGTLRLEGGSSGYVQIQPAGAAGSWTLTLPTNAGSNGYVLSTDGSGNTSWVANDAGTVSPLPPGGRLSLSSTAAVQQADVTAATTIYYLPYISQLVPVYNGSDWQELNIGLPGISLSLSPTEEVAGRLYDVYAVNNSGSPVLCAMNWGGTTARSTSTGGTSGTANASITQLAGLWVNNAAISTGNCYNGPTSYAISQNEGTLLGTFYTPTSAASSLASTITAGTTSLSLSTTTINGPGLIGVNYYEALDNTTSTEYVLVTGGWNTTAQTVVRGQLGTSAISHNSGKTVAVAGGQNASQFQPQPVSGGTGTLAGLSNIYNTILMTEEDSDSHYGFTYSTAAWAVYDNNANNETYWIDPLQTISGLVSSTTIVKNSNSSSSWCDASVGFNGSAPATPGLGALYMSGTSDQSLTVTGSFYPSLGLNYVVPLSYANGGTCTYRDAGGGQVNVTLTIPY